MLVRNQAIGTSRSFQPNLWDVAFLPLIFALLALLAFGGSQMTTPYDVGTQLPMSLDPWDLPYYSLRSGLRMLAALGVSLLFTLVYASLAAKIPALGRVLIPLLDVLQSIPILGFLSITVTGFIALFPGNLFGVECAAIFAIFTSQAWNMAFSLYASLLTVPADLKEAASVFHLSPWRRFWRLELPYAAPNLIWNMMMSVSGGWFFVVASEAISVSGQSIMLPGVGSYIALAIQSRDMVAVAWAIVAVLAGIMVCDQLIFRPLLAWADKFKFEQTPGEDRPESWLLTMMQRTRFFRSLVEIPSLLVELMLRLTPRKRSSGSHGGRGPAWVLPAWCDRAWNIVLILSIIAAVVWVEEFVRGEVGLREIGYVFLYGLASACRVVALIALASLIWVPIGVWIGLRPRAAQILQPIAQFMAAFPANLVFPVVVMLIVHFQLNVEIWTSPLMILGTQWYILFNVIAGASSLPHDLRDAAGNLGLRGWMKWKRFYLPGIFPAYITGAINASGGSWNASIVAEMVSWGDTQLVATGLGSYIAQATQVGDFPRIALGIGVMCLFVMGFNHFVWRRLYTMAAERLSIG